MQRTKLASTSKEIGQREKLGKDGERSEGRGEPDQDEQGGPDSGGRDSPKRDAGGAQGNVQACALLAALFSSATPRFPLPGVLLHEWKHAREGGLVHFSTGLPRPRLCSVGTPDIDRSVMPHLAQPLPMRL